MMTVNKTSISWTYSKWLTFY